MSTVMDCPRGHGETVERIVDMSFCEPPMRITGVPADVCPVCDERFLRFSVARRVEELRAVVDWPQVPAPGGNPDTLTT